MNEISLKAVIDPWMHVIASCFEAVGVFVIGTGAVVASGMFLVGGFGRAGWPTAFRLYRANLGRAILLGLEFGGRRHYRDSGCDPVVCQSRHIGCDCAHPNVSQRLAGGGDRGTL